MSDKKGKDMGKVVRRMSVQLGDAAQVAMATATSKKEYKDVDIAVVKATNHDHCTPKEKHVRTILATVQPNKPRAEVSYCINQIIQRLRKATEWLVVMKCLITIHRILREGGNLAVDEVLLLRVQGNFLNLVSFRDETSRETLELSTWTRTYASYLDEKVAVIGALELDVELESGSSHSNTRDWNTEDLLDKLPKLQVLMRRIMGCYPEEKTAAQRERVVGVALNMVIKESFKLYRAIYDGIINLLDRFFEMGKMHALKALEMYKTSVKQAQDLMDTYHRVRSMESCMMVQFPDLELPDPSLLSTMEEYVKNIGTSASSAAPASSTSPAPTPPPVASASASPAASNLLEVPLPAAAAPSEPTRPAAAAADPFGGDPFGSDPFGSSAFPSSSPGPVTPPPGATSPAVANPPPAQDPTDLLRFDSLKMDANATAEQIPPDPFGGLGGPQGFTNDPFAAADEVVQNKDLLDKNVLENLYSQAPTASQPSNMIQPGFGPFGSPAGAQPRSGSTGGMPGGGMGGFGMQGPMSAGPMHTGPMSAGAPTNPFAASVDPFAASTPPQPQRPQMAPHDPFAAMNGLPTQAPVTSPPMHGGTFTSPTNPFDSFGFQQAAQPQQPMMGAASNPFGGASSGQANPFGAPPQAQPNSQPDLLF